MLKVDYRFDVHRVNRLRAFYYVSRWANSTIYLYYEYIENVLFFVGQRIKPWPIFNFSSLFFQILFYFRFYIIVIYFFFNIRRPLISYSPHDRIIPLTNVYHGIHTTIGMQGRIFFSFFIVFTISIKIIERNIRRPVPSSSYA